jgi:hypothetical protein
MEEARLWEIRAFVYRRFAETARPPSVEESALHFGLSGEELAAAYRWLHEHHALYLKPGTHDILMANPFSGVETAFRVHADGRAYFANCAWDTLGIAAALQVDANIEAACAQTGAPIRLRVEAQQVQHSEALVHFLIPFRDWYNDLAFT